MDQMARFMPRDNGKISKLSSTYVREEKREITFLSARFVSRNHTRSLLEELTREDDRF